MTRKEFTNELHRRYPETICLKSIGPETLKYTATRCFIVEG
jgi:hypothetical protein